MLVWTLREVKIQRRCLPILQNRGSSVEFMKIFQKLFQKPVQEQPIKVLLVSSSTLTLDQWRKDTRLVSSAKELARNEVFRMQVAVLENSHPRFLAFPAVGATQQDRAAMNSKCEGYQLCLNNLEAMSQAWAISKPLVATFQQTEK